MPNFYSICLFSFFGCPCVFVVSGLETTFLEYLPSFRLYLPGYVFTCQTPPIPHPVKCARFLRPSECEKVLVCLLNIFCQTIGCNFIPLKMTILLVIWWIIYNLQFHNSKCWFKRCVFPSFFGISTSFTSLLWAVEYSIYPVSEKQGKEIHCCFFQWPWNSP